MARKGGIYSIEFEVEGGSCDSGTVLPLLNALEYYCGISTECVRVDSLVGFYAAVIEWSQQESSAFPVLVLNFHGTAGAIGVDGYELSLAEVARAIGGRAKGKFVHFGACEALNVSKRRLEQFLAISGASGVSGYSSEVTWEDSLAFETKWLSALSRNGKSAAVPSRAVFRIYRDCGELAEKMGFRAVCAA